MLSTAPDAWPYSVGHVTEPMMREHLFAASPETLGLMCGPPGLLNFVALPGGGPFGHFMVNVRGTNSCGARLRPYARAS